MKMRTKLELFIIVVAVLGWCSYLWLNGIGASFERPIMKIVVVAAYSVSIPIAYCIHKAIRYVFPTT